MDENTKKKPRAISARPAVRPPEGGVAAVSVAAMAGSLTAQHPAPAAGQQTADGMQVIEGGGVKAGPNVKAYIERQLKSVYDDVLNQPIPDRFLDLLNGLDAKKEGCE